jgi:hypothetical protein
MTSSRLSRSCSSGTLSGGRAGMKPGGVKCGDGGRSSKRRPGSRPSRNARQPHRRCADAAPAANKCGAGKTDGPEASPGRLALGSAAAGSGAAAALFLHRPLRTCGMALLPRLARCAATRPCLNGCGGSERGGRGKRRLGESRDGWGGCWAAPAASLLLSAAARGPSRTPAAVLPCCSHASPAPPEGACSGQVGRVPRGERGSSSEAEVSSSSSAAAATSLRQPMPQRQENPPAATARRSS